MPTSSLLAVFVFSLLMAVGAVVTPGPVSTAVITQSPRRGWLVGPLVSTGHSLLELAMVVLIAFGLSQGLAQPGVQTAIALAGGLLLLWMGGGMAWGAWRGKIHLPGREDEAKTTGRWQMLGLGAMATITNPFWYAWWVTAAAGYLAQARALGPGAIAAFYLGHISADYGWNTVLSTVVGGGRRWITDGVFRAINGACGLFLVYLGITFLLRAFSLPH